MSLHQKLLKKAKRTQKKILKRRKMKNKAVL